MELGASDAVGEAEKGEEENRRFANENGDGEEVAVTEVGSEADRESSEGGRGPKRYRAAATNAACTSQVLAFISKDGDDDDDDVDVEGDDGDGDDGEVVAVVLAVPRLDSM
jgi:hypothetical protein